jgi:acetate CoA/acetoacetate CoA-transferase alpha subunit
MIPNGTTLMTDGFMSVGTPERVVDELAWREKRSLAVIAHDTATPDCGIGKLVAAKRVRKAIVSRCHSEQISGRFAIASIRMSQGQSCHQWRER